MLKGVVDQISGIEYPCMLENKHHEGMVVLFTSRETGTCVAQGSTIHNVGEHSSGWVAENFTKRVLSVTITDG